MALNTILQATSRSGGASAIAGDVVTLNGDSKRNLLVAQGSAAGTEMARAGGIWNVFGAATAPLVAMPTTTAAIEIYNNTNSGMVMEILDVFLFNLLGTAASHNVSLWAMVTAQKAAPSTGSLVIGSQSGRAKYTDTATTRVTSGTGTTVVANGWRPWGLTGQNPATFAAIPGLAFHAEVNGKLIVPAGASICLQAVDALATGTVQCGVSWNEAVSVTVVA